MGEVTLYSCGEECGGSDRAARFEGLVVCCKESHHIECQSAKNTIKQNLAPLQSTISNTMRERASVCRV